MTTITVGWLWQAVLLACTVGFRLAAAALHMARVPLPALNIACGTRRSRAYRCAISPRASYCLALPAPHLYRAVGPGGDRWLPDVPPAPCYYRHTRTARAFRNLPHTCPMTCTHRALPTTSAAHCTHGRGATAID